MSSNAHGMRVRTGIGNTILVEVDTFDGGYLTAHLTPDDAMIVGGELVSQGKKLKAQLDREANPYPPKANK